jgi:hypothetical protein
MKLQTTNKTFGLIAVAALGFGSATAQAALIDRGGGLIYDDVLNVTWLQDARYAVTTGAAPFGSLTWQESKDFASNLTYFDSVRGVTYDDWRLPVVFNSGAEGYDTAGASSELAYMYYVNLGYSANYDPHTTDPVPTSDAYNPFINISYRGYWTDTASEFSNRAWYEHFHFGFGGVTSVFDYNQVWAVRDGDVAPLVSNSVPEPGTLGLFGAAIGLAGFLRRRKPAAI